MKSNLHRVMFLAAAAFVATGTVWAQYPVTATVPFEFKVGIAKLPAGEYQLIDARQGGALTLLLRGTSNKETALTFAQNKVSTSRNPEPHLTFRCIGGACRLVEMWDGVTGYNWLDARPAAKESGDARLAVVYLNKPAAE